MENIDQYIQADVQDPQYQSVGITADQASAQLKATLDARYSWLDWLVVVTTDPDARREFGSGKVFVADADPNRHITAIPMDKGCNAGFDQHVTWALNSFTSDCINQMMALGFPPVCTHNNLLHALKTYLDQQGLSDAYTTIISYRSDYGSLYSQIDADQAFKVAAPSTPFNINVFAMAKKCAVANPCFDFVNNACSIFSTCHHVPYTGDAFCACNKGFDGDQCDQSLR